jgi:hypothetical protein
MTENNDRFFSVRNGWEMMKGGVHWGVKLFLGSVQGHTISDNGGEAVAGLIGCIVVSVGSVVAGLCVAIGGCVYGVYDACKYAVNKLKNNGTEAQVADPRLKSLTPGNNKSVGQSVGQSVPNVKSVAQLVDPMRAMLVKNTGRAGPPPCTRAQRKSPQAVR